MFKNSYLTYLKEQLENYTPEGYTLKVIDEFGRDISKADPKFSATIYVKFGVASKQINASDRINQPILFRIITQDEKPEIIQNIFQDFFIGVSKTHSTLLVYENDLDTVGSTYDLWHNYNSPVMQSAFENSGLYQSTSILQTGVISYSKEKIIGIKYYLDDVLIQAVNPQSQYSSQARSTNFMGATTSVTDIEGANNTFGFTMLLDKTDICKQLLDVSILGTYMTTVLKIEYSPTLIYTITCIITKVISEHDTATGDNILTVTLMPK